MESYIEITFLHNLLIHSISLTLSNIYSKKCMNLNQFLLIIFITTFLPSFLFIQYSNTIIWINEILLFMLLFKYRTSTYIFYIGNRFLFHLIYYLLFDGTIHHLQFFIFDEKIIFIDFILFILYLSLLMKLKFNLQEQDYIYLFKMDNHKYHGYLDSGNLATHNQIPIIFIKENIYNKINKPKEMIQIQTVSGNNIIETIKHEIIINHKKQTVYCSSISNDYEYDALLNMKGIL